MPRWLLKINCLCCCQGDKSKATYIHSFAGDVFLCCLGDVNAQKIRRRSFIGALRLK